MNIKTTVENLYKDGTDYGNPGLAVNQTSSLHALSGDLYTDSKRFIYELLQNADDSCQTDETVEIWIKVFDDYLVFAHTGKPFTLRDIRGICNVNDGTKKSDPTKTGYKGIGFKSVFGQSEQVIIFTNGEYFRFDSSYSFAWKWKGTQETWEQENNRKFHFPWQTIPIYTEATEVLKSINQFLQSENISVATIIKLKDVKETSNAIQELSEDLNMFLFLRNICAISFDVTIPILIEINRLEENKIILKENGTVKSHWLINTVELSVSDELRTNLVEDRNIPEKLRNASSVELLLAAKLGNEGIIPLMSQERLLYSYLPTSETKYSLPVLVNTSFQIAANRESLHTNSKWNQWLFKNIAIELFRWISELVNTEIQYQAYQLIPKKIMTDGLGKEFNKGFDEAIDTIPFIVTNESQLVKIQDAIIDFTFLSKKSFVGENLIKNFKEASDKKFAKNTGFGLEFKNLGTTCFEWEDLHAFLSSDSFRDKFTIAHNIELIKHFKTLCEKENFKYVTKNKLKNLPFIRDHKNFINYPKEVCFPTADDQSWNNPESGLSFVHQELQAWLHGNSETRIWLEDLGVIEKTDITYITQTILPDIDNYISSENALQAIRDLFNLYNKDSLKEDLIKQLSNLKLLTQENSLLPADKCFLSDFYSPRLDIEDILEQDIFVHKDYCENTSEKDEWKRFFKMLGVQEGISILSYHEKLSKSELIDNGCESGYFDEEDKKFNPFPHRTVFTADDYKDIRTLNYISFVENSHEFATKFWQDFMSNYSPENLIFSATAFWGHTWKPGQINGDEVRNYIPWYIENFKCIPVVTGECEKSNAVLLNTEEIKSIAGNHLSVFDGPKLSPDWRALFNFRTTLKLPDYLNLLHNISLNLTEEYKIKRGDYSRIQAAYRELLEQCVNWNNEDIQVIREWASTTSLLNENKQFTKCDELKYFLDGNNSVFQKLFDFLAINAENKQHPNLEYLLSCLGIKILKQSNFELVHIEKETCLDLKNRLSNIIPYFIIWIENEKADDDTVFSLVELENKINTLEIWQAEELKIKYEEIDFVKNVNVHFNEAELFVTNPWNSNSVLLKLPEVLCRYFNLLGQSKKIEFLLRATDTEIQQYFAQEGIDIPSEILAIENTAEINNQASNSFEEIENIINERGISPEFFHLSTADYKKLQYVERLISRAISNVIDYLKILPEYDCSNHYEIAKSIIGGITKDGNEITIVARPSDNDEVLIYYTSEFDVLEYVDAEFWCEDGVNKPKQITFGQLLKKTGINRIPIKNIDITDDELNSLINTPKSDILDFNPVPFVPQKIAKIISSFANTNGGSLIFGLKEINPTSNEVVGLSNDYRINEITKKAISSLLPIPNVTYDWKESSGENIFLIKTEKSENDILFKSEKYIRTQTDTILEDTSSSTPQALSNPLFNRTIAIIIGIENYAPRDTNQVSPVKYANNDVVIFKKMLVETMNIDEDNIHTFLNEEALKSSLDYDLSRLFHYLKEEDRLIFYYVGHGFHNGVTNYLSTYDMHTSNIANTAVSLRKILLDPLQKSKCKNALIFIDACAQSFQDENERSQINNINEEELMLLNREFPYYGIFLSCQSGQKSYSSDILENGIWTNHLVKAIGGDVPEVILNDKYITDRLLQDYLSQTVSNYTMEELGYDQNPKAILDSSCTNTIRKL